MASRTLENDSYGRHVSGFLSLLSGGEEDRPRIQGSTRAGDMSGGPSPDHRKSDALDRASKSRWHRLIAFISGEPTDVIAPERDELYRSLDELDSTVARVVGDIPFSDDMFPKVHRHAKPTYRRMG
jgi:hypothetical protein